MPGQIPRKDDENDAGAKITSTKQTAVKVGGQPVATDGDPVAGLVIPLEPETANGNQFVKIGGIPVNRQGHEDSCGLNQTQDLPAVIIG